MEMDCPGMGLEGCAVTPLECPGIVLECSEHRLWMDQCSPMQKPRPSPKASCRVKGFGLPDCHVLYSGRAM